MPKLGKRLCVGLGDEVYVCGTTVTMNHVCRLIHDGLSWMEIMRAYPDIDVEDIRQCREYARALNAENNS